MDPVSISNAANEAVSQATPKAATEKKGDVKKEEFLRLLVAQLQHQDPLDPQKGSEFVAQLATFSQLEQSTEMNKRLESLAAGQASASRAALAALVGRGVTAQADRVHLDDQTAPPNIAIALDSGASKVQVDIKDRDGKVVKTIDLGPRPPGDVDLKWDGTDATGKRVVSGDYSLEIRALGADGKPIDATAKIQGLIEAVQFDNGDVRFKVGGTYLVPADILAIQN